MIFFKGGEEREIERGRERLVSGRCEEASNRCIEHALLGNRKAERERETERQRQRAMSDGKRGAGSGAGVVHF